MTNYERIKNLSVEEMADLIDNAEEKLLCPPCSPKYCDGYAENGICIDVNKHCHKAALKWLMSEVEQ